jgi:uracil phosphoribosyltransferase
MKIHITSHPLITHKLTLLRDENTPSPTFRSLTEEIVSLLAYEAMRDIKTQAVSVKKTITSCGANPKSRAWNVRGDE